MNQTNQPENAPYFFLVTEQYTIGTPRVMAASDRTIDVHFKDLAENYDLQCKLHLASAALLKPEWYPPIAYPMEGQELVKHAATYLAAFSDDPKEREQRRDYLINNGLVRILVLDDKLLEEVKKANIILALNSFYGWDFVLDTPKLEL